MRDLATAITIVNNHVGVRNSIEYDKVADKDTLMNKLKMAQIDLLRHHLSLPDMDKADRVRAMNNIARIEAELPPMFGLGF